MTNGIRNAAAALLFLVCLVTLTSAFKLPNSSPNLSSRLASLSMAAKPAQQRTALTFADRVAYQRAIEEVYWHHRIWPKERPDPKPALDAVMSQTELEKKVDDYLRKSQLVADQRRWPITASELQAEMERMVSHTLHPRVLLELFQALGNDPFVIAECLARPILAERLVAQFNDTASQSSRAKPRDPVERSLSSSAGFLDSARNDIVPDAAYRLPEISIPLDCRDDTWTATSITNAPDPRDSHTAVWTGSEMIVWGGGGSSGFNTGGRYNPGTDSWTATSTINAPGGRFYHTVVWTGTEMIVWGGTPDASNGLNTGGRYNPSTDTWTATSTTNAPAARYLHTAVWSGTEMIIWGGYDGTNTLNTGGRYNPGTDRWIATGTTNAPGARWQHTAAWTGSEMIIWGGNDGSNSLNTGGRYNPSMDTWTATSITNAPIARQDQTVVWTGSEMIIWAGFPSGLDYLNTGGRYNPGTDSWTATSIINAPSARSSHTAVWTGSEMIVWGGNGNTGYLNTGGRYSPGEDTWTATNTTDAPSARAYHTAVWSGSEMIVWGGSGYSGNTGGRYCEQLYTPMAQSAFSRKVHGAAGAFDIPLPLTGNVGVECRSGGATNDYQMVINFMTSITLDNAVVTSGTGMVSSFSGSGTTQITVNLTGVTDVQRITMTLIGVNDGTHMGNVPISMGVLVGDANGNALVNASDVSLTKSQVGVPVSGSNFREDVNANGTISATDVAQVKANVGTALPP
jgi:N-acetylneuraminic acid mutarotase